MLRKQKITPNISNLIEKIDDNTFKQVCSKCGGKSFYDRIWVDQPSGKIYKSERVSCELCEGGFIYGNR